MIYNILSLLFLVISFSIVPALPHSQRELNDRAFKDFQKSDLHLNQIYNQILKEHQSDKLFLEKLREAQRAWLKFRDAHIASLYPEENKPLAYGSMFPMCYHLALKELTDQRIKQLQVWLDGVEEGNACAGSIKIKK